MGIGGQSKSRKSAGKEPRQAQGGAPKRPDRAAEAARKAALLDRMKRGAARPED